ncbi:MAG: ABC transporter substrate-binding protein [Magnetococcales bacterium]|nr:ABC transporter substrate-binding protein [Magnetococcales bacterium]
MFRPSSRTSRPLPSRRRLCLGLVAGLVAFLSLVNLGIGQPEASKELRLVVAHTPTLLTGLVTLAQRLGYFRNAGLDVVLSEHATGDEALQRVESGQADLATVAETAFVLRLFERPQLRALAVIGGSDNEVRILARKDAGIAVPSDLNGKRIATQKRLSTHFFLDQFLLKNGLSMQDITPHFHKLPELPDRIVAGEVDAISTRDPFLSRATARLGENAVVFEAIGLYDKVFLLATLEESLPGREKALERFLHALIRAEAFVRDSDNEARKLLLRLLPGEELESQWQHARLRVWLDHRFLLTLENVADWAIRNDLTDKRTLPNFLSNLEAGPLRSVRPVAVNLLE